MCAVFAVIPYTTFPTIELGPLNLRTFGLCVALGVLLGAWLAASYAERYGIERDETYRVATWMVLAGIIGSRLTWAATHTDQIDSPIDVIAIWEGGIQFSGGFIAALIVGLPFFRRWSRLQRWHVLDGYAFGLSLGLAFGRIGCYSVGEHFGRTTDFFLASRYDGGDVREPFLGDVPLAVGDTFHHTALYEFLYLMVMFGVMGALVLRARRTRQDLKTGTLVGFFVLAYGICRFLSDSLRVNDERVAGLTGAQWMSLAMIPAGAYILLKVRPKLAALPAVSVPADGRRPEPTTPTPTPTPTPRRRTSTPRTSTRRDRVRRRRRGRGGRRRRQGGRGRRGDGRGRGRRRRARAAESDDAGADEEPDEAAVPTEAEVTADEEAAVTEDVADTADGDVDADATAATDAADDAAVEESPHPAK